jgi:hypothetical protein
MPELLFEKRETTLLPAASGGVSASVFIITQDEVMQARAQAQIYASQDELRRKGLELYQSCQEAVSRANALTGDKKSSPG